MGKRPVVSLEDRVPQLKQRRKKKANRRLAAVVLLFLLVILVILYFQSSFSKIQSISIDGERLLTAEEIENASGVSIGDSFWTTDTDTVSETLTNHVDIESASVTKSFPTSIMIEVDEYDHIAYIRQEKQYVPILENGIPTDPVPLSELSSHAPMLFGFSDDSLLKDMSEALAELPIEVQQSISEIYLTPTETDEGHITVYMNDGFEVSAIINTFAEKMTHYPSIISQLDPDVLGVIDLEVGSYFRAYDSGSSEVNEENDASGEIVEGEEEVETEG